MLNHSMKSPSFLNWIENSIFYSSGEHSDEERVTQILLSWDG